MYRVTLCLLLIIVAYNLSDAVNHWVATKDGTIQPQVHINHIEYLFEGHAIYAIWLKMAMLFILLLNIIICYILN